jgi:hypothetical protein
MAAIARTEDDERLTAPGDPPTISLATLERLSGMGSGDAVKMQLRAQKHRQVADSMQADGDLVGPRCERAEATRLEHEASLILDPVLHTIGPVTVGNGGEIAMGAGAMKEFADTVRERPDMLAIDASRQRMELADKAKALELGLDAAATIRAANSVEKMLAHQMAGAHTLAMELQAEGRELLRIYKRSGHVHQHLSIEAGRLFNASARMMDTFQHGMLTLQKIRNGGTQTVVVQHVNVSDGGQAMIAGQVKVRGKKGRRPRASAGGVVRK